MCGRDGAAVRPEVRRVREGPGRPIDNGFTLAAGRRDAGPKGDRARFPGYDQPMTLTGPKPVRSPRGGTDDEAPPARPGARRLALVRVGLALLSGVAGFLAFPPLGWWPAAFVSVGALSLLCRGTSKRLAFWVGVAYGMGFFVPLLTWIRTIGALAWVLLSVTQALELGVLALGLRSIARLRAWPLWTAGVWVLEEALRGRYPLGGFTWGRWGFSQSGGPLLHLAAWGGAPLVTFVVALCGSLLAWAGLRVHSADRRTLAALRPALVAIVAIAAVVAAPLAISLPTDAQTMGGPATLTAALVQGNVPRLGLDLDAQRDAVTNNHVAATEALAAEVAAGQVAKPQVVIWPENATDVDPRSDPQVNLEVRTAVQAAGVPVLVGAVLDGPGPQHVSNAGVVWDPTTGPGEIYVKRHLVPFGEYIPLRSVIGGLIGNFRAIPYDFAPGSGTGVLQLGPAKIGDVICYEVAYDGLVRTSVEHGARVLVVQTNNATYGRTESSQQLAMTQERAVEHGRAVLVASTSGISAVLEPDGRVVARSKIFTQKVIVAQVPLRDSLTVADRLGAWTERVLALIGLVGLGAALLTSRRSTRSRRRTT